MMEAFPRAPSLTLAVTVAVAAGCSSIKVMQDYTPGTDFSAYRTFSLMSRAEAEARFGPSTTEPSVQLQIEEALQRELISRGLQPAVGASPDLTVVHHARRQQAVDKSTYGRTYTYSNNGTAEPVPITKQVDEGALLVDLVDARTGRLVWRGEGKGKPVRKNIDLAAAAILAQYPPGDR